ncbi:CoA-binding protein [bacterium]|nr:CoA-binding protein [bacterium]
MKTQQTVAVLGASQKPDRYSNRAVRLLLEKGHHVIPLHPKLETIEGLNVVHGLSDITGPVDTLTLYVGPDRLGDMTEDIVRLKPGRVIFNPGTESLSLQSRLREAGIPYLEACTLVMLQTNQF